MLTMGSPKLLLVNLLQCSYYSLVVIISQIVSIYTIILFIMHGFVVINEGFTQHFVLNLFTEYFMHAEFASNMWWW